MTRQIIALRYPAEYADCGTPLAVGEKGRYYGRACGHTLTSDQWTPRLERR